MQEGKEQERRRSVLAPEEEAQAAAPQADVEDGLLEGLALVAGEVAVVAQDAVEHALGGSATEDASEGLGGHGPKAGEAGPRLLEKTGERIERDC
jgi:hypothetical protein